MSSITKDFERAAREAAKAKIKRELNDATAVFFEDVKMVNVALDCNPDHNVILTVPLPGRRTVERGRGKEKVRVTESDVILCVVTDKPEIFEACAEEFEKRDWQARVPQPLIEQRWRAQSIQAFVEGRAPKVSAAEVFDSIKAKFEYFIDFEGNDNASTFCALYTILTYFYFLFEYCPYLKLGGEKGSAKTKLGKIFAALCFNGQIFANSSAPAISRMAQDTAGCMVIDEGEDLASKDEERQAYQQVLNSGFERNGSTIRVDKETLRPTRFSTYCPKIIASIGGLFDVLEDRGFEIIMLRTLNREIANREVWTNASEWKSIRDSLYLLLMQNWKNVKAMSEKITNDLQLPGRFWDLAKAILTIAKFVGDETEKQAEEFLAAQKEAKREKAENTFVGIILSVLEEMLQPPDSQTTLTEDQRKAVGRYALSDVVDKIRIKMGDSAKNAKGEFWVKASKVTPVLRNLHLYNDPRRDGPNGSYQFAISVAEISKAKQRLMLGDSEATSATPTPAQPQKEKHSTEATEPTEAPEAKKREGRNSVENTDTHVSGSVPSVASVGSVKSTWQIGIDTLRALAEGSKDRTFTKIAVIQSLVEQGFEREKAEKFWEDAYRSGIVCEVRLGVYKKA